MPVVERVPATPLGRKMIFKKRKLGRDKLLLDKSLLWGTVYDLGPAWAWGVRGEKFQCENHVLNYYRFYAVKVTGPYL